MPRRRIDDGAVGQRMGIERCEDERVEVLANNRATGREVVGGRTDRSAHDQAVGAVGGGNLPIHEQTDLDHRERRAGENRCFIETQFAVDRHVVADHLGLEHEVLDDPELTAGNVVECRIQFEDREIGEEAEGAEVDAEHGHLLIAHPAGRSQNRSVPAEHQHQVGRRSVIRMESADAPVARQGKPGGDAMASLLQFHLKAAGLRHDRWHFAGAGNHQIELPRRDALGKQPGETAHDSACRGRNTCLEGTSVWCTLAWFTRVWCTVDGVRRYRCNVAASVAKGPDSWRPDSWRPANWRQAAAMPPASRPRSASSSARSPCSTNRSGIPSRLMGPA